MLDEGKEAFEAGDPSDACPYDQYSSSVEEQFGARYWTKGWLAARTAHESANPQAESSTGQ
ncbi:hypothetical protein ACWD4V_00885 [Streptomyces tsukubensis]